MKFLWIEILWKLENHNLGSLLQAFRLWGLHKEMWPEKKKKLRGGGVGVRARELGVPSSLPLRLFLLTFFLLPPSRRTPLSERLEQATIFVGTLQLHLHKWKRFFLTGFDPVWPMPACAYRTSPIATRCKRPDVVCLRKVKETRGHGRTLQRAS